MAQGTTIKVGIDATDVKKGLNDTEKQFSKFAKSFGNKIVASSSMAVEAIKGIGAAAGASYDFFKDLADYTGELEDMSIQTKVSMQDLVAWQRAFEVAGVPIADASRMISDFAANMQDASKGETPWRKALNEMGIYMDEIERMEPIEVIEKVLREINTTGGDRESIMKDLFGGKRGAPLLRLAADTTILDNARKETEKLGKKLTENAAEIGSMDDNINLEMRKRAAQLDAFGQMRQSTGLGGAEIGKQITDVAENLTITPLAASATRGFEMMEAAGVMKDAFTEGIRASENYLKDISASMKNFTGGVFSE